MTDKSVSVALSGFYPGPCPECGKMLTHNPHSLRCFTCMGKTAPPPQEGAEGPYRLETPDARLDRLHGPDITGHILATDEEVKRLNVAWHSRDSEVDALEAELKEARESLEGLVPKCDVCGVMTDKYIDDNGPYCSLKCWNEANGGEDYDDESILETWDKVTKAIADLTQKETIDKQKGVS